MSKKILATALTASLVCLGLTGCKTEINVPVRYSDLASSQLSIKQATLTVEVPYCKKTEAITKATKLVKHVFPKAEVGTCYNENFDSFLPFRVPVQVGNLGVQQCPENELCVAVDSSLPTLVRAFVGKGIKDKINFLRDTNDQVKLEDIKFTIAFNNDANDVLFTEGCGVFVKYGKHKVTPSNGLTFAIDAHTSANFTLGDVSMYQILTFDDAPIIDISSPEQRAKELNQKTH